MSFVSSASHRFLNASCIVCAGKSSGLFDVPVTPLWSSSLDEGDLIATDNKDLWTGKSDQRSMVLITVTLCVSGLEFTTSEKADVGSQVHGEEERVTERK